jgi:hypothetical protein
LSIRDAKGGCQSNGNHMTTMDDNLEDKWCTFLRQQTPNELWCTCLRRQTPNDAHVWDDKHEKYYKYNCQEI